LSRFGGAAAVLEPLWQYAGRDWGFIGHMAILVSNSTRLLDVIGWQHSEPILRYIAEALAGWGRQHADHEDVRPYWANLERAKKGVSQLPGDWADARSDEGFTKDLLALLRVGDGDGASELAFSRLKDGKSCAGSVWDAVHLAAGEMVLSVKPRGTRPDGNALHANTAANALHHAFRTSGNPQSRLVLTLQALAWMDLYRKSRKDSIETPTHIAELEGFAVADEPDVAVEAILVTRGERPRDAAQMAFSFAGRHSAELLLAPARRLLPLKSSGDPHDLKFPVAIFEDLQWVSPMWRPHLLAAAVYSFRESTAPDNPGMEKIKEAIANV
jgi:hypothetical protein